MNLALIIDDYLPLSTRVGAKMFHELAVEFVSRGHQVTVITPGNHKQQLYIYEIDNVKVWSFRNGPIKGVGKYLRALNETLLSYNAWKSIKYRPEIRGFDGVIYYSPSIFWGGLVKKLKKSSSCPAYLVLRDFFPQWAVDAGIIKKNSLIEKYFRFFERLSYSQANSIGVMSDNNLNFFKTSFNEFSCSVLHNWSVTKDNSNLNEGEFFSLRQHFNLHKKIIFFYGGNIGHAQDMTNLMRLVHRMQAYDNAHFLFVGQGDEVSLVNSLALKWGLNNFSYYPSIPQTHFQKILKEVDVGLFSLSSKHITHNFPGKLLGYMLNRLPVLGSVNPGNDLKEIVNTNEAGFIHDNGEDDKLFHSCVTLCCNDNLRFSMGESAYKLLTEEFSVESAANNIESSIKDEA